MNRKLEEEYRRREEEKRKWIQYHIMEQEKAKEDEEIMRKKREEKEHPKFGSRSAKWTTKKNGRLPLVVLAYTRRKKIWENRKKNVKSYK